MQLLIATTNQGKLKETQQLLSSLDIELLSLSNFEKLTELEVEETGETFEENALIKAQTYGDLAQVLTVAEDAGLVVDALDGQPGVKSARFAADSEKRNQKLLKMIKNKENRTARFVSVFCLYNPQTKEAEYFTGKIEGKISKEVRGKQGFDYDYIFIPKGYEETFAELGSDVKYEISHRQQAIEKLKTLMLLLLGE